MTAQVWGSTCVRHRAVRGRRRLLMRRVPGRRRRSRWWWWAGGGGDGAGALRARLATAVTRGEGRPSSINARIREKAEARRRKEAEEINRRIRRAKERRAQAAATNEEARARALEEAEVINARVREKLDALGPRPSDGSVAATADYSDAAGSRDTAPQASPSPYSLPVKGRHAGPPRKGSPTAISRRPSATLPHRRQQVSP